MRTFIKNRQGNVALIFALSLLPITMLIGGAIDLSQMRNQRAKLQSAADAASLAAANMPITSSNAEINQAVNSFLSANFPGQVSSVQVAREGTSVEVRTSADVQLAFGAILGMPTRPVTARAAAERGGVNIEMALVLDVTGSMAGQRIIDLRASARDLVDTVIQDVQDPYYTKAAIVPYSDSVNLGSASLAQAVRGGITTHTRTITNISWTTGSQQTPTGITRANPGVVTLNGHGYQTGDVVTFSGVKGMTQLNGNYYTVTRVNNNSFRINADTRWFGNFSTTGAGGNTARVIQCLNPDCNATVRTSANHGYSAGQNIYLSGISGSGMGALNNSAFRIQSVTNNTHFVLADSFVSGASYSSGGQVRCAWQGCEFFAFTNVEGNLQVFSINDCVSERTGAQRYTDAAPGNAPVGRVYASGSCPAAITPLTSNRNLLNTRIGQLQPGGATGGHIGIAWGWYMLSPNFASLWPAASRPVAYDTPETLKIAVLMTDGEFNIAYCNGVISRDSGWDPVYGLVVRDRDRINCDATNGGPFQQARQLCTAMKQAGVVVYTVGFAISPNGEASRVLRDCASEPSYAHLAQNGQELNSAFRAIGDAIGRLRLTR